MEIEKNMNIYAGNLSYEVGEEDLKEVFSKFGEVTSTNLIVDNRTGRSKGFGFVEMNDEDGKKAIAELDGKEIKGRNARINEARPKTDAPRERRSW